MTKQTGFKVKKPYDDSLEKLIRGKKKKVNQFEKSYFSALQGREGIKIMEFKGYNVKIKIKGARRKKNIRSSRFDIDVDFM
tara:strand:+ start:407 stop:649 length:243 start_codon:yes stop_codon:yes gene_type:complete